MKFIAITVLFIYCCFNNKLLSKRPLLIAILSLSFFMMSAQTFCEDISGRDCDDCPTYSSKNSPVVVKMIDANGCPYTATLILNVISSSGFDHTSMTACEKSGMHLLSGGSPEGGMYSGYGVEDNNDGTYSVNTSMLTPGVHAIIYTYGAGTSCEKEMKFKFEIINCGNSYRESSIKTIDFKAYPIPYSKEINIAYVFDFETDVNIQVMNIRGMLLKEANDKNYIKNSENVMQLDLSNANDQILFIKVSTNKGSVVKKIVPSNKK